MAGVLIVLIRYLPVIALAAYTPSYAQPPTPIPSRVIKVVEFTDAGSVYRVDLDSGAVTRTKAGDIVPIPPAPEPPNPQPTPELKGFASKVYAIYRSKITTNIRETAEGLAQAIEVTLAVTGGLNLKGQEVLDELVKQIDHANLRPRLAGFSLGDLLKDAIGDDPDKIVPALREAMIGLRAVR